MNEEGWEKIEGKKVFLFPGRKEWREVFFLSEIPPFISLTLTPLTLTV